MIVINDCDKCIHNKICGISKEYQNRRDEISPFCVSDGTFEYKLTCNFYKQETETIKSLSVD